MEIHAQSDRVRRVAGITAGSCAALAAVPGFLIAHRHLFLGLICISLQLVLIGASVYVLLKVEGQRPRHEKVLAGK